MPFSARRRAKAARMSRSSLTPGRIRDAAPRLPLPAPSRPDTLSRVSQAATEPALVIRDAAAGDLAAITALYNHYIAHTAITFDGATYTPEQRRPWLAQFAPDGPHRLLVAQEDGVLRGYAGTMRFREKAAYETSVETTIYVAPDALGRGLGARLYAALFASLAGEDLHRAYAGITLPNEASIRLHLRFGFRPVAHYHEVGRKLGRYWDVAWYEKAL